MNALQPSICKYSNIRQLNAVRVLCFRRRFLPPQIQHPCLQSLLRPITLKTPVWNIFPPIFLSLFVLTATWHHGSFNLSKPVFPFPLLVLKEHLNGSRRNKKQERDALKMNEIVLLLNCQLYLSLCTCRTPSAFIINVCS